MNFLGGTFYLISSIFSLGESYEDRVMRDRENLPRIYLFPSKISDLDWFGWGDVIYFVASVQSLVQAFLMFSPSVDDDTDSIYYLTSKCSRCSICLHRSLLLLYGYQIILSS